jgi:hypothetical protein
MIPYLFSPLVKGGGKDGPAKKRFAELVLTSSISSLKRYLFGEIFAFSLSRQKKNVLQENSTHCVQNYSSVPLELQEIYRLNSESILLAISFLISSFLFLFFACPHIVASLCLPGIISSGLIWVVLLVNNQYKIVLWEPKSV